MGSNVDANLPALNIPDPCTECWYYSHCADTKRACKRFQQFVSGKPETGERIPDHMTYLKIFDAEKYLILEKSVRKHMRESSDEYKEKRELRLAKKRENWRKKYLRRKISRAEHQLEIKL